MQFSHTHQHLMTILGRILMIAKPRPYPKNQPGSTGESQNQNQPSRPAQLKEFCEFSAVCQPHGNLSNRAKSIVAFLFPLSGYYRSAKSLRQGAGGFRSPLGRFVKMARNSNPIALFAKAEPMTANHSASRKVRDFGTTNAASLTDSRRTAADLADYGGFLTSKHRAWSRRSANKTFPSDGGRREIVANLSKAVQSVGSRKNRRLRQLRPSFASRASD
jgi:hypothetical protein